MSRKWIKLWVDECLQGTIRIELNSAERGIWYDLLLLGGACRVPGQISANETTPYPHNRIANILNVPLELVERVLDILKRNGRIVENEHGIIIVNWAKYQSEYQRQKSYREKSAPVDPDKFTKGKYGGMVQR